jgi:hypothetical protein
LRAGRKQQEIARFLKRAQVPGLPFEECFEPKPGCWVGRCHSCPKLKQKMSLASHGQWILWPGHPKQCQNHPGLAEGQPEGPLVQGNLAYQFKINTKTVFWLHKDSGFCGLATQKKSQNRPGLAEGQPEGPLVQGNLASQLKRL